MNEQVCICGATLPRAKGYVDGALYQCLEVDEDKDATCARWWTAIDGRFVAASDPTEKPGNNGGLTVVSNEKPKEHRIRLQDGVLRVLDETKTLDTELGNEEWAPEAMAHLKAEIAHNRRVEELERDIAEHKKEIAERRAELEEEKLSHKKRLLRLAKKVVSKEIKVVTVVDLQKLRAEKIRQDTGAVIAYRVLTPDEITHYTQLNLDLAEEEAKEAADAKVIADIEESLNEIFEAGNAASIEPPALGPGKHLVSKTAEPKNKPRQVELTAEDLADAKFSGVAVIKDQRYWCWAMSDGKRWVYRAIEGEVDGFESLLTETKGDDPEDAGDALTDGEAGASAEGSSGTA